MESFYKDKEISFDGISLENTFLILDSKGWRKPAILSLDRLGNGLQLQLDRDLVKRNVTSVEFINQNEIIDLPPESLPVNARTHIAVDENYLYVWVPQSKRWKRLPLSIW